MWGPIAHLFIFRVARYNHNVRTRVSETLRNAKLWLITVLKKYKEEKRFVMEDTTEKQQFPKACHKGKYLHQKPC